MRVVALTFSSRGVLEGCLDGGSNVYVVTLGVGFDGVTVVSAAEVPHILLAVSIASCLALTALGAPTRGVEVSLLWEVVGRGCSVVDVLGADSLVATGSLGGRLTGVGSLGAALP